MDTPVVGATTKANNRQTKSECQELRVGQVILYNTSRNPRMREERGTMNGRENQAFEARRRRLNNR